MNLFSYNPTIEDRIRNFVRTEEPVAAQVITRRFRNDLPPGALDQLFCEMVRDGLLKRVWSGGNIFTAEERADSRPPVVDSLRPDGAGARF